MAGDVPWHAPGLIFHAPRAFAAYPVGIGAAQTGILDRLVRINGDTMARGGLDHFQMMARHFLPVMPAIA